MKVSPPPALPALPALTPDGTLHLAPAFGTDAPSLPETTATALEAAFADGPGAGLLHLGAAEVGRALPQPWAFWRDFAVLFLTARLRALDEANAPPTPVEVLPTMVLAAPPMLGGEYLDPGALERLWAAMRVAFALVSDPAGWLHAHNPSWHAVGRVHLNLAENRSDPALPFAFLATYTTRLSASARPQHAPLGRAVREAAANGDSATLLALLAPVQRAAAESPWLKVKLEAGALYAPVRWSADEACAFLREVPVLEQAGLLVRMPESWRSGRPARPKVSAVIGSAPAVLATRTLLDFEVNVTLDGAPLTEDEISTLLAGVDGLQMLRGQWVEVDRARLERTMAQFEAAREAAAREGLSFQEATRMLAGLGRGAELSAGAEENTQAWGEVVSGEWLRTALAELRSPEGRLAPADPGPELSAMLRPYQRAGVSWLHLLVRLGLGACLADDMGLGKTIQVLGLLRTLERQGRGGVSLVVAPASLLGNWQAEARRFAPSLRVRVAHGSATDETRWRPEDAEHTEHAGEPVDLVLTTYGSVLRDERLQATRWRLCVLDEAQAIKNPGARQTQAVKALQTEGRVAMTGTPVENRLGDLWSLMDFLNPGLLGTSAAFGRAVKRWNSTPGGHAPLRRLVQPYLLRRKKTDRTVIADLPDKIELEAYCGLSRTQAALYQQAVDDLAERLVQTEGLARRGLILAALMRFKQICNHPSQWLGDGAWQPRESGKFERLAELAGVIAERQEKLLVFTQFRQTTAPLAAFLQGLFGRAGLVLHGETPVRERTALVARFQNDPNVPFFVLSLKAGGTGLNLTAAAHVVHFDRWWNPAVEDQATDRAFRIGQVKNVLVHKFVCRGTVEEHIDTLIRTKRTLADSVLAGGGEAALTEMNDTELLAAVALDLRAVGLDDRA